MRELMVRGLNEAAGEEREKLSIEDREEADRRYLEWQKSLAEDEPFRERLVPAIREIWEIVRNISIPGDEAMLFHSFDLSGEMKVKIHIGGHVLEVDVLKSIKVRPSNFDHPLIQWAIRRAAGRAVDHKHPASKFLKKLPDALRKGIVEPAGLQAYEKLAGLRPADPDYCKCVYAAIHELSIYGHDPELNQHLIESLKQMLDERLPGKDHTQVIAFLHAGKLPKDKSFAAFVNAFFAFLCKTKSVASYSSLVWREKKKVRETGGPISFSAEQLTPESFSDDFLKDWLFGRRVVATVEQITQSALCFREVSGEELFKGAQEVETELLDDGEQ